MKRPTLLSFMILTAGPALAVSSGAPEGSSDAPGEFNCTACHGGPANSGPGRVRIELNGAVNYAPGQKIRMRVIVEDPNASRWGFQLSTRAAGNTEASAGTLATSDGDTQVLKAGVLEWITHTLAGTRRGTRNSVAFEFDWTAPSSDSGPITLYAAANAANGDGTSLGDRIYTATMSISAAQVQPRPLFTSESVVDAWTSRPGIAAGAWVAISGSDLAKSEAHWSPAAGRLLETTLGGVSVKVNGVACALAQVSAKKILLLVPAVTPEGPVPIVIERDGQTSDPVTVHATASLPAIHSAADPDTSLGRYFASVTTAGAGTGLGLISMRGWLLGKPEIDGRAARGVYPGEEIDIYAIGLGSTEPEFPTDRLFAAALTVSTIPVVRFGDVAVTPSAAMLVSPGLYVVRAKVPDSVVPGDVPLVLDINGVTSAGNVLLNVQAAQ